MIRKFICLFIFHLLIVSPIISKPVIIKYPKNFQDAIKRKTRTTNGLVGSKYWQNKAVYDLKCKINVETGVLEGTADILYFNRSNKKLKELVLHTVQDAYKEDSIRSRYIPPEVQSNGMVISSIQIEGKEVDKKFIERKGTILKINLLEPLSPLKRISIKINWSFTLVSANYDFPRDGKIAPNTFLVAYWFPKIAVIDDLDGWDEYTYDFLREFYSEYSIYYVEISLPANFQVWATGDLENPEIRGPKIQQKLESVQENGEVVTVRKPFVHKKNATKSKVWKWKTGSVNDFTFVASSEYGWKEFKLEGVEFSLIYNKNSTKYDLIPEIVGKVFTALPKVLPGMAFPYKKFIFFDGNGGMEYPMMANVKNESTDSLFLRLVVHELLHSFLPIQAGNNEIKYAWMDEGLVSMLEYVFAKEMEKENSISGIYRLSEYGSSTNVNIRTPTITESHTLSEEDYYNISYSKAAFAFWILYDMIGSKKFSEGLHFFLKTWESKHPTPYDLFNCFNTVLKEDLNWFWRKWFISKHYPDLAIESVSQNQKGETIVIIKNAGEIPVPIDLTYTIKGKKEKFYKNASVWKPNKKSYRIKLKSMPEKLLLETTLIADFNPEDNHWPR